MCAERARVPDHDRGDDRGHDWVTSLVGKVADVRKYAPNVIELP